MSKKINANLNRFKIAAVALVAFALSANSAAWGQQPNPIRTGQLGQVTGLVDVTNPINGVTTTGLQPLKIMMGWYWNPNLHDAGTVS